MKLSYSTRGWYSLTFEDYADIAEEMNFAGYELYDLFKHEEYFAKGGPLDPYAVRSTMRSLRDRGVEMINLDTSLDLGLDGSLETALWTIRKAGSMGVGFVSAEVMTDNEDLVRESVQKILTESKKNNVTFLIKTRGIYVDTERLKNILDEFADDSLGVLWDMHHPFKDHGESPDTTIKNLGGYVKLVHIRDYGQDGAYTIMGERLLPVKDMMRALSSIDYDGFVSLEWKPEWVRDVQDYAFIFPHYINYMNRFERSRANRSHLYRNHDGTGEYIWKKDELISLLIQLYNRPLEDLMAEPDGEDENADPTWETA